MRNILATDEVAFSFLPGKMEIAANVIVLVETIEDLNCFSCGQAKLGQSDWFAEPPGKGHVTFDKLSEIPHGGKMSDPLAR